VRRNKRGVVDWTEAPDPTMRHNGAPTMVLHMKEGREWRERGAKGGSKGWNGGGGRGRVGGEEYVYVTRYYISD